VTPEPVKKPTGAREALLAAAGLLAILAVGKTLVNFVGVPQVVNDVVFTIAAGYQLYVPLWSIQREGLLPESHAIHVHGLLLGPIAWLRGKRVLARRRAGRRKSTGLDRLLAYYGRGATFRGKPLLLDMGRALLVALVTFAPFGVAYFFWRDWEAGARLQATWRFALPADIGELFLKNLLLVALPEEAFYRGYLEHRLERALPTKRTVLWIPIGLAVIIASGLFAFGHFAGEWTNPGRLAPFFPAFVFSALTRKSGSIAGAVVYHALSNVFSATLAASVTLTPVAGG
jgi:membrane protease YdiL (CAAX protease family)